ncbi:hypothetical protein PP175_26300 (plasmid) [Aneurinibacillus sp. Ricciae_BoGa-3]|uniref:hypothetical protein n=1 Tax=Aneurinibacillus sp. Ricciae_BoGa-3 TaxID=3022697 RepID=UPI00234177EC|nr:hypothetical protein [Aneurinibacillus sp. Ricciae_BoGa-3]WCK57579.1 hypothetical protein PP175_26300 [Aneurinibacillus sp. Ricciae_BoGa-3]
MREQHFENVNEMVKKGEKDNGQERLVTLYHGTSLYYLNDILLHGLVPRQVTGFSNYEEAYHSNEHLVYLTNKWHYFYAYKTYERLNEENVEQMNFPCYVECKVPASNLTIDEDFFHSKYVHNRIKSAIKKRNPILELTFEECLNLWNSRPYW